MNKHSSLILILIFSLLTWHCQPSEDANQQKSKQSTAANVIKTTNMIKPDSINLVNKKDIVIDSSFSTDYLMGKFNPTKHSDFVVISEKHASKKGMYLRKDTYNAFKEMLAAAKKDGINFTIKSATRPFLSQKGIWEAKWTGVRKIEGGQNAAKAFPNPKERALKILKFSSMPGTSRHHWGTDIDLNAFTNEYFEKGQGLKEYQWLTANAAKFGFCQPYSPKDEKRPEGYNEEKWHWSYLPVALKLTQQAQLRLRNEMISGFKGSEVAKEIQVIEKYVLGINKNCL